MRTIAILNLKGGVGKTTTAINMAAILAEEHGKRVVVIDADPQANSTQFLLGKTEISNTVADVLSGDIDVIEEVIYETKIPGVRCVPANIDLIECDIASVRSSDSATIKQLDDFCSSLAADAAFAEAEGLADGTDFVIIDCPPSFTATSVAAIYAADDVVIPIKIDAFALNGMAQLMAQISSVQSIQPRIRIAGILVTMYHNAPAVVQGEDLLRRLHLPVFRTHIRRSDKADEATFASQAIGTYSKTSAPAKDYKAFVAEYLED